MEGGAEADYRAELHLRPGDAGLMMADFPAGRMLLERHSPRLAQARQELSAKTDPAALIKFISDTSPHWQPAEMALDKLRFRRGFAKSPEMQLNFARGLMELVSCLDLLRILQLPSSPRFCRRCLGYLDQLPRLSTWPSQPELLARAEAGDIPMSAHILHDAYLCAERALTREPRLQAADALVGRCRELGFTESSDSKDNGQNPCA